MIGYLEGRVIDCTQDHCILCVHGVGYSLSIHARTAQYLKQHSSPELSALWVVSVTHDGGTHLFGFADREDKSWFSWLTGVPGVGGRVAQNILSLYTPYRLQHLIFEKNIALLRMAEGVGPKLAQRLITEMQEKAQKWHPSVPDQESSHARHFHDALLTLTALGYGQLASENALRQNSQLDAPVDELVRNALKHLL